MRTEPKIWQDIELKLLQFNFEEAGNEIRKWFFSQIHSKLYPEQVCVSLLNEILFNEYSDRTKKLILEYRECVETLSLQVDKSNYKELLKRRFKTTNTYFTSLDLYKFRAKYPYNIVGQEDVLSLEPMNLGGIVKVDVYDNPIHKEKCILYESHYQKVLDLRRLLNDIGIDYEITLLSNSGIIYDGNKRNELVDYLNRINLFDKPVTEPQLYRFFSSKRKNKWNVQKKAVFKKVMQEMYKHEDFNFGNNSKFNACLEMFTFDGENVDKGKTISNFDSLDRKPHSTTRLALFKDIERFFSKL